VLLPAADPFWGRSPLPLLKEGKLHELIEAVATLGTGSVAVPTDPFTSVDRMLIHAGADSAQEVEGAPDPLTVEDMLEEVLELNGSRHESFFPRGFVDALQDREWRAELLAEKPRGTG
jgi:sulfite reductase alpha subunit-like flavoprotein